MGHSMSLLSCAEKTAKEMENEFENCELHIYPGGGQMCWSADFLAPDQCLSLEIWADVWELLPVAQSVGDRHRERVVWYG